jgi:hypothetical protein
MSLYFNIQIIFSHISHFNRSQLHLKVPLTVEYHMEKHTYIRDIQKCTPQNNIITFKTYRPNCSQLVTYNRAVERKKTPTKCINTSGRMLPFGVIVQVWVPALKIWVAHRVDVVEESVEANWEWSGQNILICFSSKETLFFPRPLCSVAFPEHNIVCSRLPHML